MLVYVAAQVGKQDVTAVGGAQTAGFGQLGKPGQVLREGAFVDQAFFNHLGHIGNALFKLGIRKRSGYGIAVHIQAEGFVGRGVVFIKVQVIIGECVHNETLGVGVPAIEIVARQRDFITGVTVSVCILIAEGNQHIVQLVQRGGLLKAQVVQPGLVHPELGRYGGVIALVHDGERIDFSVQLGNCVFGTRILLKDLFGERAILINQVVQRQEHLLVNAITADHLVGHADGEEHVRVVAGSQQKAQFFRAAIVGDKLKGKVDVGHVFNPLDILIGFPVDNRGYAGDGKTKFNVAKVVAQFVAGKILVVFPLRCPGGCAADAAHGQSDGQNHCNQSPHHLFAHFFTLPN